MNQLKDLFLQASPREQLILTLGGGLLAIMLVVMFVLVPAQKKRDNQLRINAAALTEQQQVRELAAQVLAKAQAPESAAGGGTLIDLLNRSLPKYDLRMEDFQPSGPGDARVRLAKADLNKIFIWVNEMENVEGVQVKDLSAAPGPETGSAVVNLRLHRD